MITLAEVQSEQGYEIAASLFKAYASEINIDLNFQYFQEELNDLNRQYARPDGALYIAYNEKHLPMGCFGIRRLTPSICELKRMYLKNAFRGIGVGKNLMDKAIDIGQELGYNHMRLDTLASMHAAINLYLKAGFYEIEAYRFNPYEGAKYFEIQLGKKA